MHYQNGPYMSASVKVQEALSIDILAGQEVKKVSLLVERSSMDRSTMPKPKQIEGISAITRLSSYCDC
jgi:hypothetical protein